ncbi:MAG: hypothetical protein ABSG51_07165 [Terracidiphilus sp.]
MHTIRKSITAGSAAAVLGGLLSVACLAGAATDTKKPAAPAPKAAPAKAPAAAPKAPAAGGAKTGASTTGAHTTTTTTHTTTTTTHTTTTTGSHTTVSGGTHPGGAGAANHTAINRPAPRGSNEHVTKSGSAIRTRPGGRVSDVHDARRGVDVHHGLGGGRSVSMRRADGSRVFAERGRPGYVERGYHYGGHDFARRSYYYHGRAYDRFYRGYGYHGLMLNVYAPGFYFRPAFYGWAYNPWVAPIAFGWGWGVGTPWFGFYGGYFQPYHVYPSAAYWLTDYIVSQDLAAAYAAHQEAQEEAGAPPPAGGQPALTPEVKQMIADEVRNQLALENSEATQTAQQQDVDPASSGIARLLSDGRPHVFVAGGNLDVTDASGQECVVSDGDTLQLRDAPPSDATTANLVVMSSKGQPECQIALTVQVSLTDLQEMQNHMRETIDQGLQDLQSKQGTGGLPAAPPSAAGPTTPAPYAAAAPPPEQNVSSDVQQADATSQQAEKDVTAEAAQDNGGQAALAPAPVAPDAPAAPPAQPVSISLGQTTDEVTAALGAPTRIANLGPKVIYYYSGMKVTFKDGKVSDVQ